MRIFYSLLILFSWQQIFCQYKPVFIGAENGLLQSAVRSIGQDSSGFLWVATWDGLNQYDGHSFKSFYHIPGDNNSLSNNNLLNVAFDKTDRPWVTTISGEINLFDRRLQSFSLLQDKSGNPLTALFNAYPVRFDENHMIFLSPQGVILTSTSDLTSIKLSEVNNEEFKKGNGEVVVAFARQKELNLVNSNKKVTRIGLEFEVAVASTVKDGSILLLSTGGELYEYKISTVAIKQLVKVLTVANLSTFNGYGIHVDSEGIIRIATSEGIFCIDREKKVYRGLFPGENEVKVVLSGLVYSITEDYQGNIWVGTYSGLIKLEKSRGTFKNFPEGKNSGISPETDRIISMLQLSDSKILIGTTNGFYSFNEKEGSFKKHLAVLPGFDDALIYRLFKDKKGRIWAGTKKGLLKLQVNGDELKATVIRFHESPRVDDWINRITSITENEKGELWIGTISGIIRYSPDSGDYKIFYYHADFGSEGDTYILSLYYRNGILWAGTNTEGLLRINTADMTHTRYSTHGKENTKLTNDKIMAIHEDKKGRIWLATQGGGVNILNNDLKSIIAITTSEGLLNNAIQGILEDSSGNVWISNNKGITRINATTLKIRNFTKSDGIFASGYNQYAYMEGADGRFYFGGWDGITIFNPEKIFPNLVKPRIALTDFRIFNHPALDRIVNKEIELKYDENFFSFEMAALNFEDPDYNEYMWKLEGLTDKWVSLGNRRTVDLSNIPPGKYKLIVKVVNRDGVWSNETLLANIVVIPPFWRTDWFLVLASIIAISIVVSIPVMITRRRMRKKIETLEKENLIMAERAKTRDRIARDLHDDLASTVSGAGLYIQSANSIIGENDETAKRMIEKSASLLQEAEQAMRDIVWSVSPENDSVDDLVLRIRLLAGEMCEAAGIKFEFQKQGDSNILLHDEVRRNLYLSIKEAVINAVRHSEANLVSITINLSEPEISIIISDNGKGFRMESMAERLGGNGIKNIRKRCEEIGANVNIITSDGGGTTIIINREKKK